MDVWLEIEPWVLVNYIMGDVTNWHVHTKPCLFPALKIYVDLVVCTASMDKTVISKLDEIIKLYFVTYNTPGYWPHTGHLKYYKTNIQWIYVGHEICTPVNVHVLASPFHVLASPFHVLASPFHVLASPFHVFASPFHVLASPFHELASPFHVFASLCHSE